MDDQKVRGRLLETQIIVGSLAVGAALFLGVAIFVGPTGPADGMTVLSYVAGGFAVLCIVMRLVVPKMVVENAMRAKREPRGGEGEKQASRDETDELLGLFRTAAILRGALLEAPAFLAGVAYLIEGQAWTLVLGFIMVVGIVLEIPTEGRVERWMREQRELMDVSG